MESEIDQTPQTPVAPEEQHEKRKKEITDKIIISKLQSDIQFYIIGDRLRKKIHLFVMNDNEDFFVYENGVYKIQKTANLYVKRLISDEYKIYFNLQNKIKFPDTIIAKIPSPTSGFIHETIEYIKRYNYVSRQEIDNEQNEYINFKNGLFDIKKWKLIPHTPQVRSILQVNTSYDPDAKCPKILEYLKDCEIEDNGSEVLIEFAGYCLTTDVKMQRSLLLCGNGSNGKSVFILLLRAILGDDLVSNESLHQLEEDKYRVANLYGRTANAFPDLKDSPLKSNDVFKRLTGNDMITGERKYQHTFDFRNTAKLIFSANKPPSIGEMGGYAFYRRLILVIFNHTFTGEEKDDYLIDKLTTEEEKSGFVNLMLEGLKRVIENKDFSYKSSVEETQKRYEALSNNVKLFENLCLGYCSELGEEPTEKSELYGYYKVWCDINKITPETLTKFTKILNSLGRIPKETTIKGEKFRYYEDTCIGNMVDLNGKDVDLDKELDGTKEKFEDPLEIEYEDPFPGIPDDVKRIL